MRIECSIFSIFSLALRYRLNVPAMYGIYRSVVQAFQNVVAWFMVSPDCHSRDGRLSLPVMVCWLFLLAILFYFFHFCQRHGIASGLCMRKGFYLFLFSCVRQVTIISCKNCHIHCTKSFVVMATAKVRLHARHLILIVFFFISSTYVEDELFYIKNWTVVVQHLLERGLVKFVFMFTVMFFVYIKTLN